MNNTAKKTAAVLLAVCLQTNSLLAGYAAEVNDVSENKKASDTPAVTTVIYDETIADLTTIDMYDELFFEKTEVTSVPEITDDCGYETWVMQTTPPWKENPTEIHYPAKGTFSVDICLAENDNHTRRVIKGAKCELVKITDENGTYEKIAEWNTEDEPLKHFELEYYFENKEQKAEYKVFIIEMTEPGYKPEKEFTIEYSPYALEFDCFEARGLLFFEKLETEPEVTKITEATYHFSTPDLDYYYSLFPEESIINDSSEETADDKDSEPLPPVTTIPNESSVYAAGDINGDSKVDITDLSELSLTIIGDKKLTQKQLKAADINKNGKADLTDLARLRQYLSKVITSLK